MNQQDKEVLIYIVAVILLVFVGFKFVSPEYTKYNRNSQQIAKLKPEINALKKQVELNQAKLKEIKAKEEPKIEKNTKKVFTISRISDAQDNTSIILDEIFTIAKRNNIQLLEIDHSGNENNELDPIEVPENETSAKVKKTLGKLAKKTEEITANLTQKDLEYYQIKFLFSSNYSSMKSFLKELLQTKYYIRIDSVESGIQKGRRDIINTDLQISILLKRG